MKVHFNNSFNTLICSGLLLSAQLLYGASATTTLPDIANIDCLSETISTFISNRDILNSNMTYGYEVTLTKNYPICYHDSAYGLSILWDSTSSGRRSIYYYSWSESSGTCTPGTTNNSYTTNNTQLITSNDYDGTSSDPCAYTYHL